MTTYQVTSPVMLGCVIDAAANNLSSTAIDTDLKIPAGFVCTGVVIEEVETAGASANLTIKAKTADITLGKVQAVGGSDLAKSFAGAVETAIKDASTVPVETTVPSAKFFASDDVVTLATSAAVDSGVIRVGLVGFLAMGGVAVNENPNKAIVDPYTPPERK